MRTIAHYIGRRASTDGSGIELAVLDDGLLGRGGRPCYWNPWSQRRSATSWRPTSCTATTRRYQRAPVEAHETGRLWAYVRDDRPSAGPDPLRGCLLVLTDLSNDPGRTCGPLRASCRPMRTAALPPCTSAASRRPSQGPAGARPPKILTIVCTPRITSAHRRRGDRPDRCTCTKSNGEIWGHARPHVFRAAVRQETFSAPVLGAMHAWLNNHFYGLHMSTKSPHGPVPSRYSLGALHCADPITLRMVRIESR